jgi:hypothetical protein
MGRVTLALNLGLWPQVAQPLRWVGTIGGQAVTLLLLLYAVSIVVATWSYQRLIRTYIRKLGINRCRMLP